jgi:hypothetical protein
MKARNPAESLTLIGFLGITCLNSYAGFPSIAKQAGPVDTFADQ